MKVIHNILKESAKQYRNKIAVRCGSSSITYEELYKKVLKNREDLKLLGIKKGDAVLIIIDNSIEFIEAFFTVNICEAIIIPMNSNVPFGNLCNIIEFYNVKIIITVKKLERIINTILFSHCKKLRNIVYLDLNESIFLNNANFNCNEEENINHNKQIQDYNKAAVILFSSGTTNIPKGIMLTDNNIISNVKSISNYLELSSSDKVLLIKNINHASSITGEMLVALYNGCTLYLTKKIPTPSLIIKTIRNNEITIFFAIPTLLISILNSKQINDDDLKSLRLINYYGSIASTSQIDKFIEKFPWVNLIYSYGLTEASPRVTYINKSEWIKKKNSSGKPIKDVEIFIADEQKKRIGFNMIGEIAVKGPNVMLGYYKNQELTAKVIKNDILFTGDLGYLDNDGYLYVVGRKDNLMIISGKNVYPEEIEAALLDINGIKEALVKAKYDELLGNKIEAYIVVENDLKMNLNNINIILREKLENYKIPHYIYFVKKLEKTQNGKLIRKQ